MKSVKRLYESTLLDVECCHCQDPNCSSVSVRVDLNFGNELVTPITFECDGGKANFITPTYSLVKLGSGCI